MHYVPESSRAYLEGDAVAAADDSRSAPSFHYTAAPIYLLTAAVGGLLLADLVIGAADNPAWSAWRTVFGYRLVLLAASGIEEPEKLGGRKLFITARDDANDAGPRLPGIRAGYERAPEPKKLVILDGSGQAVTVSHHHHGH